MSSDCYVPVFAGLRLPVIAPVCPFRFQLPLNFSSVSNVRSNDAWPSGVAAVNEKLRILVTGFGPFPGAPYNPTQPLVARLSQEACSIKGARSSSTR